MGNFCFKCGAQVPAGSGFCQNCGAAMPKNTPPQMNKASTPPAVQPTPPIAQPKPPVAQPKPPMAQPTPPVAQPTPPVAQPKPPMAQPTPPIAQPTPPMAQPTPPVAQPTPSIAQPTPPVAQPKPPMAQPTPPAAQTQPTAAKKKGNNGKKIAISIVSAVLVIAVVVTSVLVIPKIPKGNSEETTTAAVSAIAAKDLKRTVMIYCVGSDLETDGECASLDIEEMIEADIDTEKNNVLVYTGGAKRWNNPKISSDKNMIFLVGEDDIEEVASFDAVDMADSATLAAFLDYGKTNYASDRYSLILWNHGAGPILGYGYDELSDSIFSLEGIRDALEASPFSADAKLEFLGFDACLMGSAETAWMFKDYAEYFIASQEVEPGYGWDYTFLESLNTCANGEALGTLIIDSYFDFYDELFEDHPRQETDLTLSCTDLSKIDEVEAAIDEMFSSVSKDVLSGNIAKVSRCRNRAKSFGKTGDDFDYDVIDLVHLTSLLKQDYPDTAAKLETALNSYIKYSRTNTSNANGVSIYHPYDNMDIAETCIRIYESFGFAESYVSYMQNFCDHINTYGSSANYRDFSKNEGTAVENNQASDLSMQLTEEQAETFSTAQYIVFRKVSPEDSFSKKEEYLCIFIGSDTTLNSDGKLTATYEDKAVFAQNKKTGEWTDFPLAMEQIYDGDGDARYAFWCMFTRELEGDDYTDDMVGVDWFMKIKNGKPVLGKAYRTNTADSTFNVPNRDRLDPDDYTSYQFMSPAYFLKTNSDGGVVLQTTDSLYGYDFKKEDGFELDFKPIENKEDYCAVFVVTDIYGKKHISGQIPLA